MDIFAVQDEIGCGVATNLKAILCGDESRQIASRYTENVDAYQAYLKGRYFFFNHYSQMGPVESLKRARQYFEQAIAIDPNYALAYAGLANCHTQMMWYGPTEPRTAIASAKAAALKSLEIDETLVEAHVALACAYCYDRDFQRAEEENRRAIAINPGYAPARHEYAIYLLFMGRADEAMAEIKRAEELDPLNLIIIGDLGQVLYYTGRYDESINQFRKLLELNAGCNTSINIGMAYLQKGMHKKAIDEFQEDIKCRGRFFETVASLACAYAVAGRKAEARTLLNELTDLSKKQYLPRVFFAYIYAALGEKEKAFEMLERAYSDRDINLLNLRNHPWLDPLRPDPRFRDLLNRVGLPE